jgi:hypothetical protein
MAAVAGNRSSQIGQNAPTLEITSFGDGQQASRGPFARSTAVAEADLAPLHSQLTPRFRRILRASADSTIWWARQDVWAFVILKGRCQVGARWRNAPSQFFSS